jgi:hypothetical protein
VPVLRREDSRHGLTHGRPARVLGERILWQIVAPHHRLQALRLRRNLGAGDGLGLGARDEQPRHERRRQDAACDGEALALQLLARAHGCVHIYLMASRFSRPVKRGYGWGEYELVPKP